MTERKKGFSFFFFLPFFFFFFFFFGWWQAWHLIHNCDCSERGKKLVEEFQMKIAYPIILQMWFLNYNNVTSHSFLSFPLLLLLAFLCFLLFLSSCCNCHHCLRYCRGRSHQRIKLLRLPQNNLNLSQNKPKTALSISQSSYFKTHKKKKNVGDWFPED